MRLRTPKFFTKPRLRDTPRAEHVSWWGERSEERGGRSAKRVQWSNRKRRVAKDLEGGWACAREEVARAVEAHSPRSPGGLLRSFSGPACTYHTTTEYIGVAKVPTCPRGKGTGSTRLAIAELSDPVGVWPGHVMQKRLHSSETRGTQQICFPSSHGACPWPAPPSPPLARYPSECGCPVATAFPVSRASSVIE